MDSSNDMRCLREENKELHYQVQRMKLMSDPSIRIIPLEVESLSYERLQEQNGWLRYEMNRLNEKRMNQRCEYNEGRR